MADIGRHDIRNTAFIIFLIICAVACRLASKYDIVTGISNTFLSVLRAGIYMGLVSVWGVSLYHRILSRSARIYLTATAVLLMFWLFVRSCKYLLLSGLESAACMCWYLFYVPMILVPLMGMFAALCLGQPEGYRVPAKLRFLYIPSILLIFLVLSNDMHQMVFSFSQSDLPPWDDYRYESGYYIVLIWMAAEVIAFFAVLIHRSCIPGKRRRIWAPLIPVAAVIIYSAGYIKGIPVIYAAAGDMTAVFTLMIMAVFESCISTGLIPSNARHDELFRCSTLGAQITDDDYNVCYISDTAGKFEAKLLREAERHPVDLGNERLSGTDIRGGHIFWIDDLTRIKKYLEKLKKTGNQLSENNSIIKADVELREKKAMADEQMRLYDNINRQAAPQIEKIEKLLKTSGTPGKKSVLPYICVISAYIKRLGNLLLLGEESYYIPARETGLCLKESVENLRLCGAVCSLTYECEGIITKDLSVMIYSAFEQIIETALQSVTAMMADLKIAGGKCRLVMNVSCDSEQVISCIEKIQVKGIDVMYTVQDQDMRIVLEIKERGGIS